MSRFFVKHCALLCFIYIIYATCLAGIVVADSQQAGHVKLEIYLRPISRTAPTAQIAETLASYQQRQHWHQDAAMTLTRPHGSLGGSFQAACQPSTEPLLIHGGSPGWVPRAASIGSCEKSPAGRRYAMFRCSLDERDLRAASQLERGVAYRLVVDADFSGACRAAYFAQFADRFSIF